MGKEGEVMSSSLAKRVTMHHLIPAGCARFPFSHNRERESESERERERARGRKGRAGDGIHHVWP